jgi:hypothetical protein
MDSSCVVLTIKTNYFLKQQYGAGICSFYCVVIVREEIKFMLLRLISYKMFKVIIISQVLMQCEFKSYGKITRVAGQGFVV